MMKGDFEGATKFYDQVIRRDEAWSAFAHYNRAYCTIQLKGDGYIRRAIDDLENTLSKVKKYRTNVLFSEIFGRINDKFNWMKDDTKLRPIQTHIMLECQLFHHIDTQITETTMKLKTIDTMKGRVTTVRRDILDLIPRADCRTQTMLHRYRQLGLLFTYNIDVEPQFYYRNQTVSSLVTLISMAGSICMEYLKGKYVNLHSIEIQKEINIETKFARDESLGWISNTVSKAIITAIDSFFSILDVSSLVPIEERVRRSLANKSKELERYENYFAT